MNDNERMGRFEPVPQDTLDWLSEQEEHDAWVKRIDRAYDARVSPWVKRATDGTLPYKVLASATTDTRVVREPLDDILRRTMPEVS